MKRVKIKVRKTKEDQRLQGEESKKLGRIAQNDFASWCTRRDITANASSEDAEGWDYFIQAKSSNVPELFLDRKPPAFSALVQVKGTADAAGRFRMTLSNAIKLVRNSPGPCFVFIAHVVGDQLHQAWLMHCGKAFIARTLKAVVTNRKRAWLNERSLSFRPRSTDAIDVDSLRARLEADIGEMSEYFARKKATVDSVGYEKGATQLRVRHGHESEDEAMEALADLVLGLRTITVDSVDMYDIRFGVPRLEQTVEGPTLSRPLVASEPNVTVDIAGQDGDEVTIQCVGYLAAAYVPFLPARYNRLRLVAPFLDFLITRAPGDREGVMLRWSTPDIDGAVSPENLDDKCRAAAVLRIVTAGKATATIRMNGGKPVIIPLAGEWKPDNPRAFTFFRALENYRLVRRGYGLEGGSEVSANDIVAVAPQLELLAALLTSSAHPVEALVPQAGEPAGTTAGERVAIVHAMFFRVQDHKLVVIVGFTGTLEDAPGASFLVRGTRLHRLGHQSFRRTTVERVEELLVSSAEHLDVPPGTRFILGTVRSLPPDWTRAGADEVAPSAPRRRR